MGCINVSDIFIIHFRFVQLWQNDKYLDITNRSDGCYHCHVSSRKPSGNLLWNLLHILWFDLSAKDGCLPHSFWLLILTYYLHSLVWCSRKWIPSLPLFHLIFARLCFLWCATELFASHQTYYYLLWQSRICLFPYL